MLRFKMVLSMRWAGQRWLITCFDRGFIGWNGLACFNPFQPVWTRLKCTVKHWSIHKSFYLVGNAGVLQSIPGKTRRIFHPQTMGFADPKSRIIKTAQKLGHSRNIRCSKHTMFSKLTYPKTISYMCLHCFPCFYIHERSIGWFWGSSLGNRSRWFRVKSVKLFPMFDEIHITFDPSLPRRNPSRSTGRRYSASLVAASHHHFYRWYVYHSQSWLAYDIVLHTLYVMGIVTTIVDDQWMINGWSMDYFCIYLMGNWTALPSGVIKHGVLENQPSYRPPW